MVLTYKKILYEGDAAELSDTDPLDILVQTAVEGTGTKASRDDHKHNIQVDDPHAITENASMAQGSEVKLARADHIHASPATWAPAAHTLATHSNPVGAVAFNNQQATNFVVENAASKAAGVKGQLYYDTDDDHLYLCTVAGP